MYICCVIQIYLKYTVNCFALDVTFSGENGCFKYILLNVASQQKTMFMFFVIKKVTADQTISMSK